MRNSPNTDEHGYGDGGDEDEFGGDTTTGLSNPSPALLSARITRDLWRPVPPPEPTIDHELPRLTWPERSAEVIRHFVLKAERWISPRGGLREWIRLNVKLAIVFAATAILVVPSVSALLAGAADWTSLAFEIVNNTVGAALALPPVILGVIALVVGWRWLRGRRPNAGQGRRQPYREDYDGYG